MQSQGEVVEASKRRHTTGGHFAALWVLRLPS